MSYSSRSRGQTEPLAAILAVMIFISALGLFVMSTQPILPGSSDETTADPTIDQVWDDIETDGTFHAYESRFEITDRVENESIPAGATVYVTVTAVKSGEEQVVYSEAFPQDFDHTTSMLDHLRLRNEIEREGTPDDAGVATRSIPVAVDNAAEIRSGTLRVKVW